MYEGKLVVERRSKSRRKGHVPPVVGQAWGRTVEEVVQQLLPSAQYNPAIGAAILRLESFDRRAGEPASASTAASVN